MLYWYSIFYINYFGRLEVYSGFWSFKSRDMQVKLISGPFSKGFLLYKLYAPFSRVLSQVSTIFQRCFGGSPFSRVPFHIPCFSYQGLFPFPFPRVVCPIVFGPFSFPRVVLIPLAFPFPRVGPPPFIPFPRVAFLLHLASPLV